MASVTEVRNSLGYVSVLGKETPTGDYVGLRANSGTSRTDGGIGVDLMADRRDLERWRWQRNYYLGKKLTYGRRKS